MHCCFCKYHDNNFNSITELKQRSLDSQLGYANGGNVDFKDTELEQLEKEFESLNDNGKKSACRKLFEVIIGRGKNGNDDRPKNPSSYLFKDLLNKVKVNWDKLDSQEKACFAYIYFEHKKEENVTPKNIKISQ